MVYSYKNENLDLVVNMMQVPIVYSPLSSFIDWDDGVDLELSCFSQMSVTVIFFPNITIRPVLVAFMVDLFDVEKEQIDELKYKHALIAVHGPCITDKSHLVQLLSSGYVNFV